MIREAFYRVAAARRAPLQAIGQTLGPSAALFHPRSPPTTTCSPSLAKGLGGGLSRAVRFTARSKHGLLKGRRQVRRMVALCISGIIPKRSWN